MNRRGVLKGFGVATAAALWPGWLREAFAGPPCGVMRGTPTLAAAIKRAHDAVKPLLVLVIPKATGEKTDRGTHFGEWLNHGSDGALAALSCAELVCAEMEAVRQLFPSAPAAGEPPMLIAEVDRSPASLRVAMAAFPPHERGLEERRGYPVEDEAVERCIARTGGTVSQALLGDVEAVQARAATLRERLDGRQLQLAQVLLEGTFTGVPPPPMVMQVAPLLAAAMVGGGAAAERRLTPVLAAAARAVYCRQRVPGSKWAVESGCGPMVEWEEDEGVSIDCGMGFVPRKSQRFLYFFTKSPDQLFVDGEQ